MKRQLVFLTYLPLILAGCSVDSPQELERLTKEDPTFKQMIVLRDQAHAEIRAIKSDMLNRKKLLDAQVEKLRSEYDIISKSQNQKMDQHRASIEANRNLLKRQLESEGARLMDKETELASYQKTLSDVQKVLNEGKGLSLSKSERQKWEERILMLSEKIRPLSDEIGDLKLQIRLKKQKIQYLK